MCEPDRLPACRHLLRPSEPPAPHADGRNVAFGRVLTGMDVVTRISNTFAVNLRPATPVIIKRAGLLPVEEWAAVDKLLAAEAAKAAAAVVAAEKAAASAAAGPGPAVGGKKKEKASALAR